MAWAPVPLIGPSSQARAIGQNPERTVNLYPERAIGNAKVPIALLGTPGFVTFCTLSSVVRGWHVTPDDRLFAAVGPSLIEILSDGTTTTWGNLTTVSGFVGFSDNNGVVVVGDGTGFFGLDLTVIAPVLTEIQVDGVQTIRGYYSAFIDQVTLFVDRTLQRVWYSDVGKPATVQGLSFFEAEALPDVIVGLLVDREQIYVAGPLTIQPFYDSGAADNPYQPIGSGLIKKGVSAPGTFLPFNSGLAFVGIDPTAGGYCVWQLAVPGQEPGRISDHAVEKALNALSVDEIAALTAYTYGDEGHLFYALHLDTTRVYDANTQQWHERAWLNQATGKLERQRQQFHAYAFGKHLFSDYATGSVMDQRLGLYSDAGTPLVAMREFVVDTGGLWARFDALRLEIKTGVGLDGTGQGTDPQAMLQYSDDGGRSWSDEIWEPLGKIGETEAEVTFWRLGTARNRVYRVSISDPVERQLIRALSDHTPLRR